MITEMLLISTGIYAYLNFDKIYIRKKWKDIMASKSQFTNNIGKTLKIWKMSKAEYGYDMLIELPYSYTIEMLHKDLNILKEGLGFETIHLYNYNNIVKMSCVKEYIFKKYEPIKLPANKLIIGNNLIEPIVVDMNKFPHALIGGDTGTGKSRILLTILTNLIWSCNNVDIHLLQIRKNDLGVFNNCRQVKSNSKDINEVVEILSEIDKECRRREKLIDNQKGYYNIDDYNRNHKKKLNYIYVVIEEFSFLNKSSGDSRKEKNIKSKCLKDIKTIVNVGRASGVFLITALQKPTSDSIPTDIKAQLCTRISLRIMDGTTSKIILGNEKATDLKEREIIVRTLGEEKGYSYTIDHSIVMKNIEKSLIKKKDIKIQTKSEPTIEEIINLL